MLWGVLLPNEAVDVPAVASMLEDQFPGFAAPLRFEPVGGDSWCYRAGDLWVSVRRDIEGHRASTYEAARELNENGLEFVLAPLAGRDGRAVHVAGGFPVVVSRHLEVHPISAGGPASRAELGALVAMVDRLHGASVASDIPVESFEFPFVDQVVSWISAIVERPTESGPFSKALHRLMVGCQDGIWSMIEEMGALAPVCFQAGAEMVLTHGDLASRNVLRHNGRLLLADWTGTMWAPRERDWLHVQSSFAVSGDVRAEMMRYYELRWALTELFEYTGHFVAPHAGTVEDKLAWTELLAATSQGRQPLPLGALPRLPFPPERT